MFDGKCYICGEPKFDSRFGLLCEKCAKLISDVEPNIKTESGLLEETMDDKCKNFNENGLFCELTGDDCCRENCDFCEINKENYNGRDIFINGEQV